MLVKELKPYVDLLRVQLTSYATFSTNEAMQEESDREVSTQSQCDRTQVMRTMVYISSVSKIYTGNELWSFYIQTLEIEWRHQRVPSHHFEMLHLEICISIVRLFVSYFLLSFSLEPFNEKKEKIYC